MRNAQKLIKAFALVLATLIIVGIFTAIIGGVSFLAAVTGAEIGGWVSDNVPWTSENYESQVVRELDMNVKATSVKIRLVDDGEPVRVETNNEYVTTWIDMDGRRLNVVEKSHGLFGWGGKGEVIVYVRKNVSFEKVKLEVGAGELDIEKLDARVLDLDLGAGRTEIRALKVSERATIDGGAGYLAIEQAEMQNAHLELGVGKAEIEAKLRGESKIDSGVGKVELKLVGREQDYRVEVDKGLGSIELNGEKLGDGSVWGTGKNRVDIDSGVGAVEINVTEE